MLLASYYGVRDGWMAAGTYALRLRLHLSLKPCATHSEVVFEPSDGEAVAALMPDGTLDPDADGALWCASSVGLERMPPWSLRRAGRMGGVRLKRIVLGDKWRTQPLPCHPLGAALWARNNDGECYDWPLILSFVFWFIPPSVRKPHCSGACAAMAGFPLPDRFDPVTLEAAVAAINRMEFA